MDGRQTSRAVTALAAAVDGLLGADLASLSSVEVADLLAGVEAQKRRLEAVDQRLVAEISVRGTAGEFARTSAADLLISLLRVTPREARARVERAIDLGPRSALTGEPLEPIFPAVATAVEVVMIDDIPHWIPPAWLDPERRPVRNTAHHLTDFDFGTAA